MAQGPTSKGDLNQPRNGQEQASNPAEWDVSVVIPVYNSEASLPELHRRLTDSLRVCARDFEIILVNDGSTDGSWAALAQLSSADPRVLAIELRRNFGQHSALLCGLRAAQFPITITMDDDLQNPPESIQHLLGQLGKGFDVVYGAPIERTHGLWRNLASWITHFALRQVLGSRFSVRASAFRAFRTECREAFRSYHSPFISIDVLLAWSTDRFSSIPVACEPRRIGRSQYTVRTLARHALNMLTGFTVWPLRFASVMGFFLTIFGIGVLGYVLARYWIEGYSVPGFPFLASIIAVFSGAQLFAMGVIGEYVARIHFRTMNSPPYAVRQVAGERGRVSAEKSGFTGEGRMDAGSPTRQGD